MMISIMILQLMPGSRPSVLLYSLQMLSLPCAASMQTGEPSKQQPYTLHSSVSSAVEIEHRQDTPQVRRHQKLVPQHACECYKTMDCRLHMAWDSAVIHNPLYHGQSMLLTSAVAGTIQNQDGIVLQPSSRCILSCPSGTSTKIESVVAEW